MTSKCRIGIVKNDIFTLISLNIGDMYRTYNESHYKSCARVGNPCRFLCNVSCTMI